MPMLRSLLILKLGKLGPVNKVMGYIGHLAFVGFALLVFLGVCGRLWEGMQTEEEILGKPVVSIEYFYWTGDVGWGARGYRIHVGKIDVPIVFPLKNWDNSVKVGDRVDLVVRKKFSWFGLFNEFKGISINHHR